MAAFWAARRTEILALVERTEDLGPRVERLALPLVLCHADLHTWNVMIDGDGEPWLVDWDEVILAPKERDLMFVVGGIGAGLVEPAADRVVPRRATAAARSTSSPSPTTATRGRCRTSAATAEDVFLAPSLGDEAAPTPPGILMGLFDPGGIVELAR